MTGSSRRKTRWLSLPIVCPYCGNHGRANGRWNTNAAVPFKLVEDMVRSFEFVATIDKDDQLSLVANVNTDSVDWESGTNLRIECMQCFGDFAVPKRADIDFQ